MANTPQDELAELLAKDQAPAQEAPQVETVDYYLGDKANKLPTNAEFSFVHDGKPVRAPVSTIINHYRQRADLDGKFAEYKKNREEFEVQQKEWGDLEPFRALQKWSLDNPEDFQAIWEMYQNRDKNLLTKATEGNPQVQPLVEEIAKLRGELGGLKEFKSNFEKQREHEADQKALSDLKEEVSAFSKEFPEVKLNEETEVLLNTGKKATLEQAIMMYGVQHGIPDFESAALKYLKPKLLEIAQSRARNETVKAVKADKQQGVISRSSTPFNGQSSPAKPRTWNEAHQAAKAELEALIRG